MRDFANRVCALLRFGLGSCRREFAFELLVENGVAARCGLDCASRLGAWWW